MIKDEESIKLALTKLQDCTNDLKFMMYFIQSEEFLKKEWQERGHNSDEKFRHLHLAIVQQCQDLEFVVEVAKNKAFFSVLPFMMRPQFYVKTHQNIKNLLEKNPDYEGVELQQLLNFCERNLPQKTIQMQNWSQSNQQKNVFKKENKEKDQTKDNQDL